MRCRRADVSGNHTDKFPKGQMCQGTMMRCRRADVSGNHTDKFPKGQMCQGTMMMSFLKVG